MREKVTENLGDHNRILDIEQISLTDLNGKIQYDQTSPVLNGSDIMIDMSRFQPGIYLLRIRGKDACHYLKVIKN